MVIRGVTVLTRQSDNQWLVDNAALQSNSSGLGYRRSKTSDDMEKGSSVPWGTTVMGYDTGDGWLSIPLDSVRTSSPMEYAAPSPQVSSRVILPGAVPVRAKEVAVSSATGSTHDVRATMATPPQSVDVPAPVPARRCLASEASCAAGNAVAPSLPLKQMVRQRGLPEHPTDDMAACTLEAARSARTLETAQTIESRATPCRRSFDISPPMSARCRTPSPPLTPMNDKPFMELAAIARRARQRLGDL